jgi:ketosteroid isomerase-like protein
MAALSASIATRTLRKGRMLDSLSCILFQVKDGRILSGKEHFFDLHN